MEVDGREPYPSQVLWAHLTALFLHGIALLVTTRALAWWPRGQMQRSGLWPHPRVVWALEQL